MIYKKWDKPTLDILRVLIDKGFSHPEIAYILKRTVSAIISVCYGNDIRSKCFVTPAQVEVIKEMSKYGFSAEDIAKRIKRNIPTVRNACYELGIKLNSKQKAKPEEIKKAVQMLRNGSSTRDVAKAIPGWSASMANHLKAKYKIVGLTRGGKLTIPKHEIDLVRSLAKNPWTCRRIAEEMTKMLGKHISESLVRGRIRTYRIPHEPQRGYPFGREWTKNELALLHKLNEDIGWSTKTMPTFRKALPDRTYESMRRKLKRTL